MSSANYSASTRMVALQKREQLKDALGKKYQIKFGTKYANLIFSEVSKFLQNSRLTEENLLELEKNIKIRIDSARHNRLQASAKSSLATGSANSSRPISNDYQQKTQQKQTAKLPSINSSRRSSVDSTNRRNNNYNNYNDDDDDDISSINPNQKISDSDVYNPFLDIEKPYYPQYKPQTEDDEWAQIARLKKQMWIKAEEERERIEEQKKVETCKTLDSQVLEKDEIKRREIEAHERWVKQEKERMAREEEEEKEKQRLLKLKVLEEKKMREDQVRQSKERRLLEREKEKKQAKIMVAKLQQQIKMEEDEEIRKRREEKERLRTFLLENDKYKLEKKKELELERAKDRQAIKDEIALGERQEAERREEERLRQEKINRRVEMMLESDPVKEAAAAAKRDEERMRKMEIQHEIEEDEKERKRNEDAWNRNQKQARLLREQMEERKQMKIQEKEQERIYQIRFKKELEDALAQEQEEKRRKRETNKIWAKKLEEQMAETREDPNDMSNRERALNSKLLKAAQSGGLGMPIEKEWNL